MEQVKTIADFLQNQPLYSKMEIHTSYYHPRLLCEVPFQFFCPNESRLQTFLLNLEPQNGIKDLMLHNSNRFQDIFDSRQTDDFIKFIHHFSGQCQYCKKYKVDFLLNVFSDGPIPGIGVVNTLPIPLSKQNNSKKEKIDSKLYIRKIGQFPAFEINPEKEIINFFQDDDKAFYKKALICLSQSFGIGAYAYMRRIVENEILRIVESLAEIQTTDGEKIKSIYETYKQNKQMNTLIESIFNHLPGNIKSLGINPLRVLYAHLSGGIHKESEEECLKKAFAIDAVLRFTIKKLYEEKHELKEIRDALKGLGH